MMDRLSQWADYEDSQHGTGESATTSLDDWISEGEDRGNASAKASAYGLSKAINVTMIAIVNVERLFIHTENPPLADVFVVSCSSVRIAQPIYQDSNGVINIVVEATWIGYPKTIRNSKAPATSRHTGNERSNQTYILLTIYQSQYTGNSNKPGAETPCGVLFPVMFFMRLF